MKQIIEFLHKHITESFYSLLSLLVMLNILDICSTYVILSGGGWESNYFVLLFSSVFDFSVLGSLILLKIIFLGESVICLIFLYSTLKKCSLIQYLVLGADAYYMGILINNLLVIHHLYAVI